MRIGLAGVGRIGAGHAETLRGLGAVEEVVLADADPVRARRVADKLGVRAAGAVEDLFTAGLDALVVAAPTAAHAALVTRAVAADLPVFCEKPLAADLDGTVQLMAEIAGTGVPVQVGLQRRFDPGHIAAREAVRSGSLGWVHTVRSCTLDPAPPPAEYLPTSGGLFRDCSVHDFDAVRFVTGREVVRVTATGANRGDAFFAEAGDIDTGAALLTLDDGTIALVSAARYNAAGYDVRLEVLGSKDSVVAGLDDRTPVTPAGPGLRPAGPPHTGFLERFAEAYAAELRAFVEVAAGRADNPCPPGDCLEALYVAEAAEVSRAENRPVDIEEVRR
ncbi:Gfo/Idh/MocA family oxidoreductase [Actinomadura viridis]|uniref:Myo-inositol 2-dehydrogenase/D-chiro-inositol 1-dehydrogenase n=1 Tax=Actinomadura viridis TaxID=58110 RepID=A0A931DU57_9ACTN|nr:Gfo/Idh/MocA family oxidoreductase [Actinomadura viridis]MBG6093972.1 myo-inositol 2-dehydrogenase/D-chiro-inositol 1-dehydrogenase [Actinomadura viridis]